MIILGDILFLDANLFVYFVVEDVALTNRLVFLRVFLYDGVLALVAIPLFVVIQKPTLEFAEFILDLK